MFNSTQDDLKTQESYLGRNMQKAIENEANGRWPVGLESLQNILGKQGNMVTVDNMLLLRNHHPALFQRAKKCVMQSEPVNPNLTSPMVAVPVQIIHEFKASIAESIHQQEL